MKLLKLVGLLAAAGLLLVACGDDSSTASLAANPQLISTVSAPLPGSAPPSTATPFPTPLATAPVSVSTAPSPSVAPPAVPSARETNQAAMKPALPKSLVIPVIGVDAPVEDVGKTPDGAMDVPKEWNDVGWFDLGPRPGELGNAVMAGHLDSTTDRAVFWDLKKLKPNDSVTVKFTDGTALHFAVLQGSTYPYDNAPLTRIFGPASLPLLNLITCSGAFDRASMNYNQRLVVYTREVLS